MFQRRLHYRIDRLFNLRGNLPVLLQSLEALVVPLLQCAVILALLFEDNLAVCSGMLVVFSELALRHSVLLKYLLPLDFSLPLSLLLFLSRRLLPFVYLFTRLDGLATASLILLSATAIALFDFLQAVHGCRG